MEVEETINTRFVSISSIYAYIICNYFDSSQEKFYPTKSFPRKFKT